MRPWPGQARLLLRPSPSGPTLWTEALGEPASVYGERTLARSGRQFRRFEPGRSKLAAALTKEPRLPPPRVGTRWLYLGAANGTTASHQADLLGPRGCVYAVERSPRTFVRLLSRAATYPNLWPILGDARQSEQLDGLVGAVDGIYCDVAQPDQVEIVRHAAAARLVRNGRLLFAVKLASLPGDRPVDRRAEQVERALSTDFRIDAAVDLAPFHRHHRLLAGTYLGPGAGPTPAARLMPSRGRPEARPPSRYPRRRGGGPFRRSGPGIERSGPRPSPP